MVGGGEEVVGDDGMERADGREGMGRGRRKERWDCDGAVDGCLRVIGVLRTHRKESSYCIVCMYVQSCCMYVQSE